MRYRHVHQKDKTGCGLAAVAMITGDTYDNVKKIAMENDLVDQAFFETNYSSIKKLLSLYKIKFQHQRKFQHWREIPMTSIVATNFTKDGSWHWVVFVKDENEIFVYDPWQRVKKKTTDFRGRDLGKYIGIIL
jgi:ABC-type bacteriocin/lantibiotic exporter with double-glycine peptidase domain